MAWDDDVATLTRGASILRGISAAVALHRLTVRDVQRFGSQFVQDPAGSWRYTRRRWGDGAVLAQATPVSEADQRRWCADWARARGRMNLVLFAGAILWLALTMGGVVLALNVAPPSDQEVAIYAVIALSVVAFLAFVLLYSKRMSRAWDVPASEVLQKRR